MTGPTHRQYSVCFALLALMLVYFLGILDTNYYLSIPVILMSARFGAIFPDIDHEWKNVPDKTVVKKVINILIHATGGKHRSWQTHSIDICAVCTALAFILPDILYKNNLLTVMDKSLLSLLMIGFCSGWVSHMFSDMLNGVGVKLFCFLKIRVAFVPKKLGKFRFNTGNEWEAFNYKVIKLINIILGVIALIYPLVMCGYIQSFLEKLQQIKMQAGL